MDTTGEFPQIQTEPHRFAGDLGKGKFIEGNPRRQQKIIAAVVRNDPYVLLPDSVALRPGERETFVKRSRQGALNPIRDSAIRHALSALPVEITAQRNDDQLRKIHERFQGDDPEKVRMRKIITWGTLGSLNPDRGSGISLGDLHRFVYGKVGDAIAFEKVIPRILKEVGEQGVDTYLPILNEVGKALYGNQWVYLTQLRLAQQEVRRKPRQVEFERVRGKRSIQDPTLIRLGGKNRQDFLAVPVRDGMSLIYDDPERWWTSRRMSAHRPRLSIGRGPENDIAIPSKEQISRNHARMSLTNTVAELSDLNSTNGTFVAPIRPYGYSGEQSVPHQQWRAVKLPQIGRTENTIPAQFGSEQVTFSRGDDGQVSYSYVDERGKVHQSFLREGVPMVVGSAYYNDIVLQSSSAWEAGVAVWVGDALYVNNASSKNVLRMLPPRRQQKAFLRPRPMPPERRVAEGVTVITEVGLQERAEVERLRLTREEEQSFMKQIRIHGEPFPPDSHNRLTPQDLEKAGLLPQYEVRAEDAVIRFSRPFSYDGGKRMAVIGYVKEGSKYIARSYYLSRSQGMWRYLPKYEYDGDGGISWYSKGYGEAGINVPIMFQEAINSILTKEGPPRGVRGNPDFYLAGTARPLISPREGTYQIEIEETPIPLGFEAPRRYDDRSVQKLRPEQITFDRQPQNKPDFSRRLTSWQQKTTLYGDIQIEVYAAPSGLRYMFCRDKNNRVWIGGIENASRITSVGLKQQWIDGGDLVTPADEYYSQTGGYVDMNATKIRWNGDYVDMFGPYISRIPIIKEYMAVKGIRQ